MQWWRARVSYRTPLVSKNEYNPVSAYRVGQVDGPAYQWSAIILCRLLYRTVAGRASCPEDQGKYITLSSTFHDPTILALLAENIGQENLLPQELVCI